MWREQRDQVTDCYFCMTAIRGYSRKNKSKISYPVCKSAIKPVSHSPDLPVPQPPTEKENSLSVNACESTSTESEEKPIELDPSFQHESAPLFINQERLNDLVRFYYAYELMLCLHVFRQTGPPRRVDCPAPPSVCHIKTEASR